jgi:hypothetical protein
MVSKGMGGPRRAAATMRATAQGAGQLGQFLASARDATDPRVVDWVHRVRAQNLSANDLVLEVVKEVLPNTGSVDEESIRNAAAEALGQLYEVAPEVDIFNLTDAQIGDLIGYIVANDLCNRVDCNWVKHTRSLSSTRGKSSCIGTTSRNMSTRKSRWFLTDKDHAGLTINDLPVKSWPQPLRYLSNESSMYNT